VDQCINPLQDAGKVTLGEVVDDHDLNAASVNVGEAFLILEIFCRADDADNDQWFRVEFQMTVGCLPSDAVTLFD